MSIMEYNIIKVLKMSGEMKYIFGPVPSRRLGESLGISPIPKKACNYSCIYCQLGRTDKMTAKRQEFFPLDEILEEFDSIDLSGKNIDVITIVGEGEPTLYSRLGDLIIELQIRTDKPIAVITNGALLADEEVRNELLSADIVLPSLDSVNHDMFKRVDRAHGSIKFDDVYNGLVEFSKNYRGQLYLELMLMDGINDDDDSLMHFKELVSRVRYDRLYINTPVRPPAEADVNECKPERIARAVEVLGGISIDSLASGSFASDIADDYDAVISIIGRHPMNQFEIGSFLKSRENEKPEVVFDKLKADVRVEAKEYKGYVTYRLK